MRTRHRVCLILLLLACAAAKGSKEPALPDLRIEGADFPFPSGLRILFQRDPTSASAYVSSVIDAGAAQDPAGKEGLAHLVEHLAFRARAAEGGPTVSERLVAAGASGNAHTRLDVTQFDTVGPANSLAAILALDAERIGKPLQGITEEDLRLEREIVKSEIRWRREGAPSFIAYEELGAMLFPKDHPYHRSTIGSDASLDRIVLADVRTFSAAHYRPEKTTIVVAGPIELAATGAILARSVPRSLLTAKESGPVDLAPPRAPRVDPKSKSAPPAPPSKAVRRVKGPVTNTTVVLGWALPGGYRERDALIDTTVDALESAVGTLLYPVYGGTERVQSLQCWADRNRESTLVTCAIDVAQGEDPEKVATRAVDGVWELWKVDNDEWRRRLFISAQRRFMRRIYGDALSIDRTVSMAEHLHFTGRADRLALSFADLGTITGPEVRALASKWLDRSRVVKLIIEPADEPGIAPGVAFDRTDPYAGATLGGAAPKPRTRPEITSAARANDASDLSQLTLDNGLKVVILRRPGAPFVRLGLLTGGGPTTFDPWGATAFLFTKDKADDSLDIAGIWEEHGYPDAELLTLEAPASRLDEALGLMKRRVETTRSTFSGVYVQKDVRESLRRWQEYVGRDPRRRAARLARRRLFQGHPLAVSAIDPDSLASLSDAKFEAWLDETLAPKNATLFVVGDIDRAVAEEKAIAIWKTWRAKNPGAPHRGLPALPPPPPAREVVIAPAPGRTQAEISIACRVDAIDARSDVVRESAAVHLERMLTLALREQTGATYGVRVDEEYVGKGAAMLSIRTAVRAEAAAATLELLLATLDAQASGKGDAAALSDTLYALARRTHLENRSNGASLHRLATAVHDGRSPDDLAFRGPWLASVTPADIQKMLAPCSGKEIITVVGPQPLLYVQLAKFAPTVAAD